MDLKDEAEFEDFTPTNLKKGEYVTYADVLSSLFGWTSRVPTKQINVFIRGNELHCIQRGKESSFFDISNLPHSRPTINQKLNRVLCHNPNKSNTDDDDDDDDEKKRYSGSVFYKQDGVAPFNARFYVALTYDDGLLTNENITMQTGMFESEGEILIRSQSSSTTYAYTTFVSDEDLEDGFQQDEDEQYYLSTKKVYSRATEQNMTTLKTTSTITEANTHYHYRTINTGEGLYLFHEETNITHTEIEEKNKEITYETKDTYHFPAGNGFYAQAVYHNGILQGANISQGAPSNRVSPYTVNQMQRSFVDKVEIEEDEFDEDEFDEDFDDQLDAIVDDSFPIKEKKIKEKLNAELKKLNRATVETVTVDLISNVVDGSPVEINHVVDFKDKIRFNRADYFLVSNTITFTPRKFIQKLQLIRWI